MGSFYTSVVLADAPIAYYPLNDAVGNLVAEDLSGNGYTGTINGGVTLGQGGLIPAGDPGGTAMAFNGNTGYIALPSALSLAGFSAFSAEVWFSLPSALSGGPRLLANSHTDADNKGFEMVLNGGGFVAEGNGTVFGSIFWGQSLAVGVPYHYVMAWDSTTLRAYLNGVSLGSTTTNTSGPLAASGFPINIGRNPAYNGDYAKATMQHVAFYAVALSAARVGAHYQAGTQSAWLSLSGAELSAMQAVSASAMDVVFTQKRNSPTQGPTRNTIDTYTTINTLNGNLAHPSAALLQNYDYRVGDQATWLVRVPIGTDLRASDRLITSDGQTLDVQVLLHPKSYPVAIEALAAEVK